MHPFGELSGQRRQLAEALRVLRVNAGLSGEQLAKRLQVSQSRVSRIELAQQAAAPGLVRRWIEATGASEDRAADLVGWAEAAVTESVLLRTSRSRGLAQLQRDSLEFEATSKTILEFDPVLIPGLLQVPEYARRVFIAGKPLLSPAEIAAAVAGRMERQLALYEGATRFEFVITEVALRWWVGPPNVMLAQLDRITAFASMDTVLIRIIPLDTEVAVWHEHGFAVFEDRPDDDPAATVETQTSQLTTTDPAEVAFYREAFARLRDAALHGPDAEALLRRIREGLLRAQSER